MSAIRSNRVKNITIPWNEMSDYDARRFHVNGGHGMKIESLDGKGGATICIFHKTDTDSPMFTRLELQYMDVRSLLQVIKQIEKDYIALATNISNNRKSDN